MDSDILLNESDAPSSPPVPQPSTSGEEQAGTSFSYIEQAPTTFSTLSDDVEYLSTVFPDTR